jgi:hypothetical protein
MLTRHFGDDPAGDAPGRSPRNHVHPSRRWPHGRPHGAGHDPPVSRPASDHLGRGADRRRAPSQARRGVAGAPRCPRSLVLNERPECGRYSLEVLPQPLEKGLIAIPSLGHHCPCPSLHPTNAAPCAEEFAAVAGGRDLRTGHPAALGSGARSGQAVRRLLGCRDQRRWKRCPWRGWLTAELRAEG